MRLNLTLTTEYAPGRSVMIEPSPALLAYRGSIAHGMFVPSTDPNSIDDVDLMAFVIAPPAHYIGLSDWGSRGTKEIRQDPYDVVVYEIRKAFSLLLQGNPNILSLLWTKPEHQLAVTWAGSAILEARSLFVGKHVYNSFAGYASAQLHKMENVDKKALHAYLRLTEEMKYRGIHPQREFAKARSLDQNHFITWTDDALREEYRRFIKKNSNIGYMGDKRKKLVLAYGYDAKNASHCIRLLRMAREFLTDGEMRVFRPDAAELLAIKRGEWQLEEIKQYAESLFAEVKIARDNSPLPEQPDHAGAERLCMEIIREALS